MADIYNVIARGDLNKLSTDELKEIVMHAEDANYGLALALKTVGELARHSLINEEYAEENAKEHLSGLSDLLMYLPRIMCGIQQNSTTAQFEISRRKEGE
ncbi:hypothetical protein V5085_05125 [Moellerella wisconsensis]|uniref:hypothetical protein n=1 Tax=Moellerella wisconsensis TaxID=158849 RepID=UPI0030762580